MTPKPPGRIDNLPLSRHLSGPQLIGGRFVQSCVMMLGLCVCLELLYADESMESSYERARAVLPGNLKGLVRNETVQAHWFPSRDSFWYQRQSESGMEYLIVDARTGEKKPAFDHQRMAKVIAKIPGVSPAVQLDANNLQVTAIQMQNGNLEINLLAGMTSVSCKKENYSCSESESSRPEMNLLPSPAGKFAAFVRNNNLWIRSLENQQDRQLTFDGEAYFGYGIRAEQQKFDELRSGREMPFPPMATHWSPDGSKLIVQRLDERQVLAYPFVEMAPNNGGFRPVPYSVRIPLLGDSGDRETESFIIDVESGKASLIKLRKGFELDYFVVENTPIAWSEDGNRVFMLSANAGGQTVRLIEVMSESGESRVLIEEESATSVTLNHGVINPNVRILNNSEEVIWFSERDGWGHLYLYDLAEGKLKNSITSGDWLVWDIVHVDEKRRQVFFIAGGRETGEDPYYRHLYKVSLDGGAIILLTPENADHDIQVELTPQYQRYLTGVPAADSPSESAGYFVDRYSTVDQPPVTVLRSLDDGQLVSTLEEADVSSLRATGWRAPQRFSAIAADGKTRLHGVLYLPSHFDQEKSYPIIDAIYGGPVSLVASRSFSDAYSNGYFPASVAELGFAVVMLDGRGTPYRSRAFRESGFGSFADPQLDDHVAVIRQLAERHSSLDSNRVGVYGHSNGGYLSARALLKYPEVFKVGFASAGPQNFQGLPGTGTPWFGVPDYGDGAALRPDINTVPDNYKILDNATFASQLQGRLMLACGELDYTAFPALTMQLAAALIKANKSFDMLYLPGSTHRYFVDELYVTRRLWDYFVENLGSMTAPRDFDINGPAQSSTQ